MGGQADEWTGWRDGEADGKMSGRWTGGTDGCTDTRVLAEKQEVDRSRAWSPGGRTAPRPAGPPRAEPGPGGAEPGCRSRQPQQPCLCEGADLRGRRQKQKLRSRRQPHSQSWWSPHRPMARRDSKLHLTDLRAPSRRKAQGPTGTNSPSPEVCGLLGHMDPVTLKLLRDRDGHPIHRRGSQAQRGLSTWRTGRRSFGAVPALECCVTLDEPLPALNPTFASPKAQK